MQFTSRYFERFTPNYTYMFNFEEKFMHQASHEWMLTHRKDSILFTVIYIALVYMGRHWMANRPKYDLRGLLTLWNLGLAIFSFVGVLRTIPEFYHVLKNYGFYHSICISSFMYDRVAGYWVWLFVLSKVFELGDTMFIVLRKQKLIFLHWYHHSSVLIYSWFSFAEYTATGRWFVVINYSIHSMMYSYYAVRAARYFLPQWIAMMITSLQILQMVVGTGTLLSAYIYKVYNRRECHISMDLLVTGIIMYSSFFVLFFKFFLETYVRNSKPKSLSKSEDNRITAEYSNGKVKSN